jgi:hypothetical protein
VAKALNLPLVNRPTNCHLAGNTDLTISGAPVSVNNAGTGDNQCNGTFSKASVETTEMGATNFANSPASLVTIQAGADDIQFGDCMLWELTFGIDGKECVSDGVPTRDVNARLDNVTGALTKVIEETAPNATNGVDVLNYYNPIPAPGNFARSSIGTGSSIDPVCSALSLNYPRIYNDATILQHALNNAIRLAVTRTARAGFNVRLVDIADLEVQHEMCTGAPALFSGELMPGSQFGEDLATIASGWAQCKAGLKSGCDAKQVASNDIHAHVWRAAHPNTFGQADIAKAVEAAR